MVSASPADPPSSANAGAPMRSDVGFVAAEVGNPIGTEVLILTSGDGLENNSEILQDFSEIGFSST